MGGLMTQCRAAAGGVLLLIAAGCGGSSQTAPTSPAAAIAQLAIQPSSVQGGDSATGTVTLNAPAPSSGTVVALSSSDGAASTASTVTIAGGSTSGTFSISTAAVTAETAVTISATAGGERRDATLRVMAVQPVLQAIEVDLSVFAGGQNTRGTIRLSAAAPSGGLAVTVSSTDSAVTVPSSVTVPAGAMSQTFTITTRQVTADVRVTLTASALGQTRTVLMRVTPPPLPPAIATSLSLTSSAGDFIGQGRTIAYSSSNASFSALLACRRELYIRIQTGSGAWDQWQIEFASPVGSPLAAQSYSDATRFPFQPRNMPGLGVGGEGRGCNRLYGNFSIDQLVADPDGRVRRFRATFEQRCEQPTAPPLRGEISLNDVPLYPINIGSCNF